jgi:sugar phosphate isomerase/epimerase
MTSPAQPPVQHAHTLPARADKQAAPAPEFSLSTMWAFKNFPSLEGFFEAACALGFSRVELNHQVNSAMLAGIDLSRWEISSLHEPCPADISVNELKARDWLISAPEEANRTQGVLAVKRSIDFASALGVKALVVHAGDVRSSWQTEKELCALFRAGQAGSPYYQQVLDKLKEERQALVPPRFAAVQQSVAELLEYAAPRGVCLGLENRFHYMDIPSPAEMEQLLTLGSPAAVGFWFDVGHALVLDRLGLFDHQAWLERFAGRMLGVHLHDVIGIDDHHAPGLGEADFTRLCRCLPGHIIRTFEVKPGVSPAQLQEALRFVAQKGCGQP